MKKIVVILYGPPGSGKGTQANLLAEKFNLIHFDTGKFFEGVVHDPKRQKQPIVARERKLFDTGMLMTPSFVLREVQKEAKNLSKAGWGVVFSGSPRTLYEAEGLYPVLDKLYGKKNVFIFVLNLPPAGSIKRNSARLVCTVCSYTLLTAFYPSKHPKYCPMCAGPFYKRTVDHADIIKIRLREYENRTFPIISLVKKQGYKVIPIDARVAPYKVLEKIYAHIKNAGRN